MSDNKPTKPSSPPQPKPQPPTPRPAPIRESPRPLSAPGQGDKGVGRPPAKS